jgi:hypothetical protein
MAKPYQVRQNAATRQDTQKIWPLWCENFLVRVFSTIVGADVRFLSFAVKGNHSTNIK